MVAHLAKVTSGRDCKTFYLASMYHLVSTLPRVPGYADCLFLVPFCFFPVARWSAMSQKLRRNLLRFLNSQLCVFLCCSRYFVFSPFLCQHVARVLLTRTDLDTHADSVWLKIATKRFTRFHGIGAPSLIAAMFGEQSNQRLGDAEGVIPELQDQLQRVAAGHQAAHEALQTTHQEMNLLRSQIERRSRIRLVEPKSLMPDRFSKKTSPSWRTWSFLARDFVGVVQTVVKQAMKNADNQKQPMSVTHLQHE